MNTPSQSGEGQAATPSGVAAFFVSEDEAHRAMRAHLDAARVQIAAAWDAACAAGSGSHLLDLIDEAQRGLSAALRDSR